ncbi:MAG TPA: GreA/GreB family elongation factor, partial [Xanthomonadales bacterium]|nr:GreA/GreB family elongation factor [Xanthomonadales bacterium]
MKCRARPCRRHRFPPEIITARCVSYQVVGEDEADPGRGKICYVAPIVELLIGAVEGAVVALVDGEAEVVGGAVGGGA